MDTNTQKRCLVVVGLLATVTLVLAFQRQPETSDKMGVRLELPGISGNYLGRTCLFCQNQLCDRSRISMNDDGEKACPLCGSALDVMSIAEKALLPPDTIVVKKQYRSDLGEDVFAMIVATGKERRSIHRPETCLPAQGYAIEKHRVISVAIPGRDPLRVMLLDLRASSGGTTGLGQDRFSAYAYWFASANCETPYHLERMLRMSADRAIAGVNYRWAYVAVATNRREGSSDYVLRLSRFIAELYPLILPEGKALPPSAPVR